MIFRQSSGTNEVLFDVREGYAFAGSKEPQECAGCHEMHHFYINRHGETKCLKCDDGQ